jgi:hypothetical protein
MNYGEALKLHNEDEVTVKSTGEVVRVISTEIDPDNKVVITYAMTNKGYTGLNHNEIS